jgi:23S rRNA pseudouridine2457 synthase
MHSMNKQSTGKINFRHFLFYKPYGVLCQFTDEEGRDTLANYGPFPKDIYPAGRLDYDSEGLVLLTNDGSFKHRLLEPKYAHPRTYLVQVEGIPKPEQLEKLRNGITIYGQKLHGAEVSLADAEPNLPPRPVPIRFRKSIPTTWIELTIREGRNRQVRKMTAAVGLPTLRLVRIKIGGLTLDGLVPGQSRELSQQEVETIFDYLDNSQRL